MAIFKVGVTFSKAHHFGYPAVSFRGCWLEGSCFFSFFLTPIFGELKLDAKYLVIVSLRDFRPKRMMHEVWVRKKNSI